MPATLNPYLNFRAKTREAMAFYQTIFGGELTMSTFTEGGMDIGPAESDNVMHSQLSGGAVEFMAADVPSQMDLQVGNNITMSLFGADDAALTGWYEQLADGGTVALPLNVAPWGDKFGMCVDKFGVSWMVNITQATT